MNFWVLLSLVTVALVLGHGVWVLSYGLGLHYAVHKRLKELKSG